MANVRAFLLLVLILVLAACGSESTEVVGDDIGMGDIVIVIPDAGDGGATVGDAFPDKLSPSDSGEDGASGEDAEDVMSVDVPGICDPPAGAWCACEDNDDCASGWCIATVDGKVCTTTCISDEDCEGDLSCEQIPWLLPDILYLCVQSMSSVCKPCEDDEDCRSDFRDADDRCLDYGAAGHYCGLDCSEGQDCPASYACYEIAQGDETLFQCQPESGSCSCNAQFDGLSTPCYRESEGMVCWGERVCSDGAYSECDAPAPQVEDCNGVDDDCNGLTDDELGTEVCGLGACFHEVVSCQEGQWVDCDPFEGQSTELCDGVDNDCDGTSDEEWTSLDDPCDGADGDSCERGTVVCSSDGSETVCENDTPETLELCNTVDDDCDGATDEVEDLGETTCGLGVCLKTVLNCLNGQPQTCEPMAESVSETCDLFDNDCDGATDEELGETTCGQGDCLHAVQNCAEGVEYTCDPMEGARTELCDGHDDDCDGDTDEDWSDWGEVCDGPDADVCARGALVCSDDGSTLVCEGDDLETLESCNGADDDCDGTTDEAEDLGETTCGLGICEHTVDNCVNGQPTSCDPMEGADSDDLPDVLFRDTNCDGIDGDLTRALFVSRTAAPGGDGSREQPFDSVAQALIAAQTDPSRDQILIAGGTYYEQVTLMDGVGLYGGYDAANWARDIFAQETLVLWQDVDGTGSVRTILADGLVGETVVQGMTVRSGAHPSGGGSSYAVWARNCAEGLRFEACEIRAGAGNPGADGVERQQAASGTPGTAAEEGDDDATCLGVAGDPSGQGGGHGGNGVCPGVTQGGDGGDAGCGCHILTDPNNGSAGAGGAAGGGDGDCTDNGSNGGAGADGTDGGSGLGSSGGTVDSNGLWVGAEGEEGDAGTAGGGGGGGGGGDCWGLCNFGIGGGFGGGGGGGGGGGCGGLAGDGGQAGGGSFAVFLIDSSPALVDCFLGTVGGGLGGDGTEGGQGGSGGNGSSGGDGSSSGGDGGNGGLGGDGGDGGNGGGGAGGPSAGIWAWGSSEPTCSGLSFLVGASGAGGAPGGAVGILGNVVPPSASCDY